MSTTTNTASIIEEFCNIIDVDRVYTEKEFKQILSDIYKTKMGKKKSTKVVSDDSSDDESKTTKRGRPSKSKLDENGNIKPKKKPTSYNIFMKSKFAEFKMQNTDKNAKEIMALVAGEWKKLSDEDKAAFKSVEE